MVVVVDIAELDDMMAYGFTKWESGRSLFVQVRENDGLIPKTYWLVKRLKFVKSTQTTPLRIFAAQSHEKHSFRQHRIGH